MTSASAILRAALKVRRSGSPGPAPTSAARPIGFLDRSGGSSCRRSRTEPSCRNMRMAQDLLQLGNTGAAIRAGPQRGADGADIGQPVAGDCLFDISLRDRMTGADDL